ncbi:hypothetical protein STEG23_017721, partial [Scotinomys teguina]
MPEQSYYRDRGNNHLLLLQYLKLCDDYWKIDEQLAYFKCKCDKGKCIAILRLSVWYVCKVCGESDVFGVFCISPDPPLIPSSIRDKVLEDWTSLLSFDLRPRLLGKIPFLKTPKKSKGAVTHDINRRKDVE